MLKHYLGLPEANIRMRLLLASALHDLIANVARHAEFLLSTHAPCTEQPPDTSLAREETSHTRQQRSNVKQHWPAIHHACNMYINICRRIKKQVKATNGTLLPLMTCASMESQRSPSFSWGVPKSLAFVLAAPDPEDCPPSFVSAVDSGMLSRISWLRLRFINKMFIISSSDKWRARSFSRLVFFLADFNSLANLFFVCLASSCCFFKSWILIAQFCILTDVTISAASWATISQMLCAFFGRLLPASPLPPTTSRTGMMNWLPAVPIQRGGWEGRALLGCANGCAFAMQLGPASPHSILLATSVRETRHESWRKAFAALSDVCRMLSLAAVQQGDALNRHHWISKTMDRNDMFSSLAKHCAIDPRKVLLWVCQKMCSLLVSAFVEYFGKQMTSPESSRTR